MTDHHSGAPLDVSALAEFPESLTARVQARVNEARLVVGRRARVGRPKSKRSRRPAPDSTTSSRSEEILESKSLRRVFRDFGTSYRRNRRQTGDRVVPGLRDAAYNFRAKPSFASLVAVAAYLDELDLLS